MTFHPGKPRLEPDPCAPSSPAECCSTCRRRSVDPGDPELRPHTVVLDVSIMAWPDGRCPMRIPGRAFLAQEVAHGDAVL